jgi:U3 small nucleolar RNA-associated protein 22
VSQDNSVKFLLFLLLQQVFRPPLEAYDVLIRLIPKVNSRRYEAVDVKYDRTKYRLQAYFKQPGEKIPVTGFNPVNCFLAELRVSILNH